MRMSVVAAMVAFTFGSALAEPNSMNKARDRILTRATLKALEDAKAKPTISLKVWAAIWRRKFDALTKAVCDCPYRSTALTGQPNACAVAAFDEFTLDLMPSMFRLPNVADMFQQAIDENWSTARIESAMQSATEEAMDEAVPAKEQLQRQAKLRRCMEQIGVL